jgi:MFS family permease
VMALSVGCIFFGALADRFGAARVLIGGCLMLAVSSIVLYQEMAISSQYINILYSVCGFFVGVIGVVPSVAVKSFPAVVRFSGLSFSYNVAYAIFGGLTPIVVTLMLPFSTAVPAYYVAAMGGLGVMIGLYLWRRPMRNGLT